MFGKSKGLHGLIVPKLNSTYTEIAPHIPGKNGFDVCRRMCRAEVPVLGNSDFAMKLDLQRMALATECNNIAETKAYIIKIDKKKREYPENIWQAG